MPQIYTRCPACHQLHFIPTEQICENPDCRYATHCHECGIDLDPTDYEPELRGNCSTPCRAETLGWSDANV